MTSGPRIALFLAAAAVMGLSLLRALGGLPDYGEGESRYHQYLSAHAVDETHAADLASAINFDYRALDTLGEEYILFASVIGVAVLLREPHKKKGTHSAAPVVPDDRCLQDAVAAVSGPLVAAAIVLGIYITMHAQLTPGGGFQGGAILGTATLVIYLANGHEAFAKLIHPSLVHAVEAVGAGGYVAIGLAAWLAGGAFLENLLPLGKTGDLISSGTIPLISLAVGLEVSAGFSSLFVDFISELHRAAEETEP